MKKFWSIALLALTLTVSLVLAGCESKSSDSTEPSVAPMLSDLEVDVTDRPSAISLGTYRLNDLYVDGKKLGKEEYAVRNGYMILACSRYGALGLGTHTVKLDFAEEDLSYSIKVSDKKTPIYTYSLERTLMFMDGEDVTFPVVQRENPYQDYDTRYLVTDENNREIFRKENLEAETDRLVLNDLALGDYRLRVQIRKSGALIKEHVGEFSVEKYVDNIFDQKQLGMWKISLPSVISKAYNEKEGAMAFTTVGVARGDGLFGPNFEVYYPADTLREALKAGCKTLSFEYKVNQIFADTPETMPELNGGAGGIRLYAKTVDGQASGAVMANTPDVFLYKDLTECPTEYTRVDINIEELLALSPDIRHIAFVLSCSRDGTIYFRNARFRTAESGLHQDNIFDADNAKKWFRTNHNATETRFDEANDRFALKLNWANDNIEARDLAIYFNANYLRSALAAGKTKLTFRVSGTADTLRIYARRLDFKTYETKIVTNPEEGIYLYGEDVSLSETPALVEIDLETFLALDPDTNYLALTVAGAKNSELYVSEAGYR